MEEQLIDDLLDATDALLADDAPGWQAGEEDDSVTPRLDKQLLPLVRQQAYELQQLSSQLASLKDALEERKLIEKAKSLLMTHQECRRSRHGRRCARWPWTKISAWLR